MQAVVVVRTVSQEKRRRLHLTRSAAAREELRVAVRVANVDAQRGVPSIGNGGEDRIGGRSQAFDDLRERIGKILVLAAPEPVPGHDHSTAKYPIDGVQLHERSALVRGEEPIDRG